MSSECEASESRLITPPPPAASSSTQADSPASQNMGDVLAKDHKDDEELEASTTSPLDELPPAEESPTPDSSPIPETPPVPNEKMEELEDRLSADGILDGKDSCKKESVEDRLLGDRVPDREEIHKDEIVDDRLSGDGALNEEQTCQDDMVEDRLLGDGLLNEEEETCKAKLIEDRLSGDGVLNDEEEIHKNNLIKYRLLGGGVSREEKKFFEESLKDRLTRDIDDQLIRDGVFNLVEEICKVRLTEDRLSEDRILNEENDICKDNTSFVTEEQQCTALTTEELCNCEKCKWKRRELSTEDLEEMMKLKRLGMDLKRYIRYTFNWFTESSGFTQKTLSQMQSQPPDLEAVKNYFELKESVILLCDRVPYHLFMWLVGQAQEFVIIVKFRLITLLHDRNVENLAEVFLTKLLDGYESLLATAEHISELLEPLQKELFSKVNLTWNYINKSLYQNYVYNDPLIQNNLPPFLGQLRKHLPTKGSEYHHLVHRYLAFDEEITKVGILCPEIERLIDKYNAEQLTGSVMKRAREDFEKITTLWKFGQPNANAESNIKREALKEEDEITTKSFTQIDDQNSESKSYNLPHAEIQSMFSDWKKSPQQRLADLVEALTLSSELEEEENKAKVSNEKSSCPSILDKALNEGIGKTVSLEKQACLCQANDVTVDAVSNLQNESQHLQECKVDSSTSTCDEIIEAVAAAIISEPSDGSSDVQHAAMKQSAEVCKEPVKKISKTTMAQTAQTQTRHSTTQTPSTNHSQSHVHRHHHQGRCSSHSHLHGSLSNAVFKSSGPHRTHVGHNNHPSAAVTCHKQQHIVEHIKRLSTTDLSPGENGDCSDSGSSHEDSCSATNSPTPRDSSRHCDCCYCEVFGHGVPSVAPVSRNFNEMRERLRQLLSKKKANGCKVACNPHIKNSVEVSSSSSSLSSSSSTSSTITNVDSTNMPNPVSRSNTPVSTNLNVAPIVSSRTVNPTATAVPTVPVKPTEDLWNIEAAVEFIEGNQNGKKDKKKAEKKARQKQKKLEEKLKKEKEEEERLKLIELQKKTPEVTITVVNPQKSNSQKAVPQQKLPEVSILPTSVAATQSVFSISSKQANTAKKKGGSGNSNSNSGSCSGCGGDGLEVTNINVKNTKLDKFKLPPATVVTTATSNTESVKRKTVSVDQINEILNLSRTKTKTSERVSEPVSQPAVNNIPTNLSNLTKKERKKLKREMLKQEEAKKELDSKKSATSTDQMQIVTIKRIMESNSAEPTVTITLKGQTPAEDRVLFTLVNGQTKDSAGEKSGQQGNAGNNTTSKKKKNKANNATNQQQQGQTANKSQQSQSNNSNSNSKSDLAKNNKQQQQQQLQQQQKQANKDKSKVAKQQEDQKSRNQQNTNTVEIKNAKSKKDKNKNGENKENIMKQVTNESSQKQDINSMNKKMNKTAVIQPTNQKQQQQQQQQQQSQQQSNSNKNSKANKNQNQTQNQSQNQKKNNNQNNSGKLGKNNNGNSNNNISQNVLISKADNQKVTKTAQSNGNKQKQAGDGVHSQRKEVIDVIPNGNYFKETNNTPSTINIENLKLPPGITITKVDAPVKPLPLKTHSLKTANNSPKQSTIIAAPMSGVQSNYGSPQGTGNVIVVDTGRLKQDLMPKNSEKEAPKDSTQLAASKKKKKKKNKNATATNGNGNGNSQNNKPQQIKDYMNIEPARILHNPSTNMVTIRNPAFGPPPPKMEIPTGQQAAIIKYSENGMVTIRSPALQQAINAGLPPPPKPDFIIKGGTSPNDSVKQPSHNSFMNGGELSGAIKGSNGMPLSTDIAELRRRLAQQPDSDRHSTGSSTLFNNGLSSIQISKVMNGQSPYIPESGINLKGTSVTLTKIRSTEPPGNHHQQSQQPAQQQQHFEEPKANAVNGNASSKSRKKKKRGNGVRQSGDDWNLVESVFTPKDIDLEDGEMDDAERELEAFKRFCLQSVPPPRKEKVNLNIKDIVLKKKSSSAGSSSSAAAAVVAAI